MYINYKEIHLLGHVDIIILSDMIKSKQGFEHNMKRVSTHEAVNDSFTAHTSQVSW